MHPSLIKMRCLIIYKSVHHGNTEKIAEVMAEALNADIKKVEEVGKEEMQEYDIIGMGSGIFFGKHHRSLLEFVDSLPPMDEKRAFIFSTRGGTPTWLNHRALRKRLRKKGFRIIGEFSCKGYDTFGILRYIGGINKGRPDGRDMDKARKFTRKISKILADE